MTVEILALPEIAAGLRPHYISRAEEIFWETAATKNFVSYELCSDYCQRWFRRYHTLCDSAFFLALENNDCCGYLAGCFDTFASEAATIRADIFYYTPAIVARLSPFPAHFHINIAPRDQGKGIGSALVRALLQACRNHGVSGVHVVTGAGAPAAAFYEKLYFQPVAGAAEEFPRLTFLGQLLG